MRTRRCFRTVDWQRALDASEGLSNVPDVTSDGCAGGTSEEIQVLDDKDEAVVDVSIDHCGTSAAPDLADVVGELLALFDLNELLATG